MPWYTRRAGPVPSGPAASPLLRQLDRDDGELEQLAAAEGADGEGPERNGSKLLCLAELAGVLEVGLGQREELSGRGTV
jgi:hypothetical protein